MPHTRVNGLASAALDLTSGEPRPETAPEAQPLFPIRALDWPCWEAPSLLEAWDGLARCAAEPNPFFESWQLLPALRVLDPDETVQLLMFEAGGALAGMIPLVRVKRQSRTKPAHLETWIHPEANLGSPLVAAGREREFWRALLDWADGWGGYGRYLRLSALPLDGPLYHALREVLHERRRPAGLANRDERPMLAASTTPEAYAAASLSAQEFEALGGHLATLSCRGDLRFEVTQTAENLEAWINRFLELEAVGDGDDPGPARDRMFRHSLEGGAQRGRLERLTLTLDGQPIAMLANLIVPPGVYCHRSVSDPAFAEFSPALLLQCENLLLLDREDIAWADSCQVQSRPEIEQLWRERRAIGAVSIAIGGKWRRALFPRRGLLPL